jgi:hypothetical protein
MLRDLFRRLAGPDAAAEAISERLRFSLTAADTERDAALAQKAAAEAALAEAKASVDRHQAQLAELADAHEATSDELTTYKHLLVGLLLKYGDTTLTTPVLMAAASMDFDASRKPDDSGVELTLTCD